MREPLFLIRSDRIEGYKNKGAIFEWSEGKGFLIIDRVAYGGKTGAILCYSNPPVHQVGNPGLDAYLDGLGQVFGRKDEIEFLVLYGANDAVHAGGDLKESLAKLNATMKEKKDLEAKDAPKERIDELFNWADNRLKKGSELYGLIRKIADNLRVVAVCGGGTRYGGSAEIPLMADYLVGDSRSGMCFSEAMIGLLPGWGGIARTMIKAGKVNAEYMAKTGREVKAYDLEKIGIYNEVVTVTMPFPKKVRTDDPDKDIVLYEENMEKHNMETGILLLPAGLHMAVCPSESIRVVHDDQRLDLANPEDISKEVARRFDPHNYSHIWDKPLFEVKDEIKNLGRPLAPQSIEALEKLFESCKPESFDELKFMEDEMKADARLYRDPKFHSGLMATLEQKVADYREKTEV
ncbi:enoyl-CoA hydratase/isomerase family protein [Thermodesulfobacteriota bacterium]